MIIIINGPIGAGKSTISEEVCKPLFNWTNKKIAVLDVDHLVNVYPKIDANFGPEHYEFVNKTLSSFINWYKQNGYGAFVINYVFNPQQLHDLMYYLHQHSNAATQGGIYSVCLWSHHTSILSSNIKKRTGDLSRVQWELDRAQVLRKVMLKHIPKMELGNTIIIHNGAGSLLPPIEIADQIVDGIRPYYNNPATKIPSLDFNPKYIEWTLSGIKKATTRRFKEERSRWRKGDLIKACNSETKLPFALLRLKEVEKIGFALLSEDLAKIENFESLHEFKSALLNIYPELATPKDDDTVMHVFHFTVVYYL